MKKNKKLNKSTLNNINTVNNGLAEAFEIVGNVYNPAGSFATASPVLLSLQWVNLAYMYKSNSFVRLAVDMPVEDAFRDGGFDIECSTLDPDELDELKQALEDNGDIERIKECAKWGRLYGGSVLMVNTNQKPETPFSAETIYKKPVEFIALDRWQCFANAQTVALAENFTIQNNDNQQNAVIVDKSRIMTFTGATLPYFLRNLLQGWGASILEAIIPQLNEYLKANSVIFELLDEAKIDVVKIAGLMDSLISDPAGNKIKRRLEILAQQKNYKGVIGLDTNDDYEQKQLSFGSLDQILEKIFLLICSALRFPYSKVFGKGANGMGTGAELDMENYNAMINSDVRVPLNKICKNVVQIRACQLFGHKLDGLKLTWKPLRVLSDREIADLEAVKIKNYTTLLEAGVLTRTQVAEQLNNENIILFTEEELNQIEDNDLEFEEGND